MGSKPDPVSPTVSSISPSCAPATVSPNATSQCDATVQGEGDYSSTVRWSTSAGTITATGVLTAPAAAGGVTVTATSTEDVTKSGTASVMVQMAAPTIVSVSVACTPATVAAGTTSQCAATIQGTGTYNSAVTWSTSAGTITAAGVLTTPAAAGSVTVTATSSEDATRSGTAAVMVQAAPATITSVVVTCAPATIAASSTSQCAASVEGTGSYSPGVMWSTSAGTITANGLLTAPAAAADVLVTATSTQALAKVGTSIVTVVAAPTITSVAVTCNPTTIAVSGSAQCAATVLGTGSFNGAVTWSATGGSITANGLFTAPATASSVIVTATSTQQTNITGTALITVQPTAPTITSITVSCDPSTVAPNATAQCTATVLGTGSYSSGVTWSGERGVCECDRPLHRASNGWQCDRNGFEHAGRHPVGYDGYHGAAAGTGKHARGSVDGREPKLFHRGRPAGCLAKPQPIDADRGAGNKLLQQRASLDR